MSYKTENDFDQLSIEIDKVITRIQKHTRSKFQPVQDIIDATMRANGKLLRPRLLMMSAMFGTYESERMVNLASAIELLHMATLIHDDIVDDATLRRNFPSVQSQFGKDMAVYTGDYLLSKALTVFKPSDYEDDQIIALSKVIGRICESELLQYFNRYHFMSVRHYLRVVSGKTAALFSLSMYLGAIESGCSEALSKTLGKIGYEIGIAFQIIDDILDFSQEEAVMGKTVQNDVKKGYYTLPVIYAFEGESLHMDTLTMAEIVSKIKENNGIEKSRILAQKYTEKAFKRIDLLPDNPSKDILLGVATKLLRRSY